MKKILVSAGHSDVDPGATGCGFREADLTKELRNGVAVKLIDLGAAVVADGAPDVNLPLKEAIAVAKTVDGPKVEFHFNAGSPAASGVEALSHDDNKNIARALCSAVGQFGFPIRGAEGGWKSTDSGQHSRLGFCDAGGTILEVCFITNQNDMDSYQHNKDAIAEKIAGVLFEDAQS